MAAPRTLALVDTASVVVGRVDDGTSGRYFFQVTAYSGLTSITPEISVDGATWVTTGITPYSRAAVVVTITATGGWIVDSGCNYFRLTGVGTGTATIVFMPCIGS